MAKVDRDACEEGVELGLSSGRFDKIERGGMMEPFGQAFDLVGVEHGIGLQHPAGFVAPLTGVGSLNLLGVALVEDREGGLLALADLRPETLGLVVGHPVGRSVAAHVRDHPQPEHIHAAIGNTASAQGA